MDKMPGSFTCYGQLLWSLIVVSLISLIVLVLWSFIQLFYAYFFLI